MDVSKRAQSPNLNASWRIRLTLLLQVESLLCCTFTRYTSLQLYLCVVGSVIDAIKYCLQGRGCQLVASRAGHSYNTRNLIAIVNCR